MKLISCSALLTLALCLQCATAAPSHITDINSPWNVCGCRDCGSDVWNADANGFSCGSRIEYLVDASGFATSRACRTVAATEFPSVCGRCNPDTCSRADDTTVSNAIETPPANANDNADKNSRCGCQMCEKYAWQVNADGYSCGERIDYLLSLPNKYATACRQVAVNEFPAQCGLCNPDYCSSSASPPPPPPKPPQFYAPPTELYCYPPTLERTRFNGAWGKYTLEVKDGVCGPSDNLFSNQGISLSNNRKELTLEFARHNGRWHASEVRVLLPAEEYYDYGTYSFSVKSIEVIDRLTGDIVGDALPPSIVLGLFTWDDTKNYAIKEDYNQEVDIEISRWDVRDNKDVQFLVQPPGNPQMYRFYSGAPPSLSLPVYHQAPHTYEFDWEPAEIEWASTAGGGHTFTYGTKEALAARQSDYTQCMPANAEVRMNLWNLFGSGTPTDMEDSDLVRVVIDNFEFRPSGRTAVVLGGVCSKDCHCGALKCIQNRCTSANGDRAPSSSDSSIAAATGDEEEVTTASRLWREHRWLMLGSLVSLVTLLAIISFCYYYLQHKRRPAIVEFYDQAEKSVATDEEEDAESEQSSSLDSEIDPYHLATTTVHGLAEEGTGQQVEAGESMARSAKQGTPPQLFMAEEPASLRQAVAEESAATSDLASSTAATLGDASSSANRDLQKTVTFSEEVQEVELRESDEYGEIAVILNDQDGESESSSVSLNTLNNQASGEGMPVLQYYFGDWVNRLNCEVIPQSESKVERPKNHYIV